MSTLYIRVPSKAAADSVTHWTTLPCPFALASRGDAIEREGVAALAELSDAIGKVQRVVLLIAASDVTLLRVQVPPLSPSRLRSALPNLVEDQLMSDPAECTIVAGPGTDGVRTVAVVNRGWLDILADTMVSFGATHINAFPAQLCLPWQPEVATAAVAAYEQNLEVTLRLSEYEGIGLPTVPEHPEAVASEVIETLCMLVPEAPITLYVPQAEVPIYRDTADAMLTQGERITVHAENWVRWIEGVASATPDLLSDRNAATAANFDWRPWRWPLVLVAVVLLINIIGLNVDWWRMKSEAAALNTSMIQTYKSTFPKEPVVLDPVGQMKQKIATAQHQAGQLSSDDFIALVAAFGEAWEPLSQNAERKPPALASLEYRDHSLLVHFKSGPNLPIEQLKTALAVRNLSVTQNNGNVLQIRSAK